MYVQKARLLEEHVHFKLSQPKVREVMLLDINNIKSSWKKFWPRKRKKDFPKLAGRGEFLKYGREK